MKLFIWREVFTDYTDGIAFAMANNEAEARALIKRNAPDYLQSRLDEIDRPADEAHSGSFGEAVGGGA